MGRIDSSWERLLIGALGLVPVAAHASCSLPETLDPRDQTEATERRWTIENLVQVRKIQNLAISDDQRSVAFVLRQSCVASGATLFALYAAEVHGHAPAEKLLEARVIEDLASRPGTPWWTLLADIGFGLQLYEVRAKDVTQALLVNAETIDGGGNVSLSVSAIPHQVGVLSFGWSPDGSALWYARPLLPKARKAGLDGIVFDWNSLPGEMLNDVGWTKNRELRYFEPASGIDRQLASVEADGVSLHWSFFGKQNVRWQEDSGAVDYQKVYWKANAGIVREWWTVDVESGDRRPSGPSASPDRRGDADERLLPVLDTDQAKYLHGCVLGPGGEVGACIRDALTVPPEIVTVSKSDRRIVVVARPNSRYVSIAPLTHEHAEWTNRHGYSSDGYITYPRGYVPGQRYPTLVITHGRDAQDRFNSSNKLGSFFVDVFAEQGYLILAVNEAAETYGALRSLFDALRDPDVTRNQFMDGLNTVATVEAAVDAAVRAGLADPARVGIMGWSRGGEIVGYAMTQSGRFRAAVEQDGIFMAQSYWVGTQHGRQRVFSTYGGSPYGGDPATLTNYRRFHPSFRAEKFAGPILMLRPGRSATRSLELPFFLKQASVPVEVVYFPREDHGFYRPETAVAAMRRSLEWFDYWLRDRRDPAAEKSEQYARWDKMAAEWRTTKSRRGADLRSEKPIQIDQRCRSRLSEIASRKKR